MRSFEPPARLRSPWRAPSLPQDQRDLRAPPRIRVSVLSRQRSDQKSLELRIPCVGYLIARGLGAPDADDDRRLSPEHRAPAIRTLSRSRFNCARRLTSSMLVSRRTVRLQTLLLTVISLNSAGRGHDGKLGFVTTCQQCLTDGCRWRRFALRRCAKHFSKRLVRCKNNDCIGKGSWRSRGSALVICVSTSAPYERPLSF
jgi:hypothetical protein